MAAAMNGVCRDNVQAEGKTESFQCESFDLGFSSGRVPFKGVNMTFLTVKGHQMFTLNEILEKLFPNTPRTTVCTRMEKMKAFRHACTKDEIRKMKALGGAKPSAINCTMIARKHVVEYCEKFGEQNDMKQKKSAGKGNINTPYPKDLRISGSALTGYQVSKSNASAGELRKSGLEPMEDLQRGYNEEAYKESTQNKRVIAETQTNESGKENGISEKQYAVSVEQDVRHSKLSNSVSWRSMGVISPLAGKTTKRIYEQGGQPPQNLSLTKKRGRLSNSDFARERKRRADQVKSHTRCSKRVGDCNTLKRQKKSYKLKGKGTFKKKNHLSSLDDSTVNPPTCYSNFKQVHRKAFQTLNLEYLLNDDCKPAKRYHDNNNNDLPLQPHSPTLLLKRSVNNEWHVARTTLPHLNFDLKEQTASTSHETLSKVDTSRAQATCTKTAIDISELKSSANPPIHTWSKASKTLSGKGTKSGPVGRWVSSSKDIRLGLVKGKKSEAKAIKTVEQKSKGNQLTQFRPDVIAKDKTSSGNFDLNRSDDYLKPAKSSSTSVSASVCKIKKGAEETMRRAIIQETSNELEKRKMNKASDGVVKQTRRRRLRLNSFRLIETIPYPSLLTVKDGDLCPLYTMTYSSAKRVPGSCHPLWRWRLGKPVLVPKQSQVKPNQSEQQTRENYEKAHSAWAKDDGVSFTEIPGS